MPGVLDQRVRDVLGREDRRRRPQFFRQLHGLQDAFALRVREPLQGRRFHVDGMPGDRQLLRQPRRAAHDVVGPVLRTDAAQDGGLGFPDRLDRLGHAIGLHVVLDPVGGPAQREFPQGHQVALAEEIPCRTLGLRRQVDLARLQAPDQLVRRRVHQHDLVRAIEERIGQGLLYPDARDAADGVVQALEMLDIERRVHIDAGVQQFLDVLPALRVTGARHVAVRQFVDQDERRVQHQRVVQVEFRQGPATAGDLGGRHHRQALRLRGGFHPTVRLDHAGEHIDAGRTQRPTRAQHRIGLADASRRTEIDAQAPSPRQLLRVLEPDQQRIGIGSAFRHYRVPFPTGAAAAARSRLSFNTLTRGSPMKPNN